MHSITWQKCLEFSVYVFGYLGKQLRPMNVVVCQFDSKLADELFALSGKLC